MLRIFVLLLLLANGGYFAWAQGWLKPVGFAPQRQGEPERLEQQIRPELLRMLPSKSAGPAAPPARTSASGAASRSIPQAAVEVAPPALVATAPVAVIPAAPPPGECLEAGAFDAEQAATLRRAAASLPSGSWMMEATSLPGRWMVYIGRLASEDAVAQKRSELRALDVPYDRPGAALEPGLSLGRFSTEEAAQRGLALLTSKGVRSARVVVERRELPAFTLRLPSADASLRAQVLALGTALAGKTLRACD